MRMFHLLGLVILASTFSTASAQDLKKEALQKKFEELLPGMGAKDIAARFGPQQEWQAICYKAGAPGNEAMRLEVCQLMIAKLGSQTPDPARIWLLKQLAVLGRGEAVDAVAALLQEKDALIHDATVRCLANNPAPEATARLIAALPNAAGKARIGLVNALGFRADNSAVKALAPELRKADYDVAKAAARALGKIGSPLAQEALAVNRLLQIIDKDSTKEVRLAVADAYLVCADHRLREGKKAEAKKIYEELSEGKDEPRSIHLAAFQGVLKTAGEEAGPLILAAIAGKDMDRKGIAIAQIHSISPGSLTHLAANIDKLHPPAQVALLGALAARGDKSQAPVALEAVKHKDENVRKAAILALGKLGDATVVGMLIDTALANTKLNGAAQESLTMLAAKGVDEAIVTGLKQEKNVAHRKVLIAILENRRAATAVPVLLEDARGSDAGLRITAMNALRRLADPVHVPALTQALLKTDKGAERDEAERTIVMVCGKIVEPEKQAEPVLDVIKKATDADKLVLLPVLARIGGTPASLKLIREAVAGDNADLREAGVRALCNWPEGNVSDDLLKLIQETKNSGHRQSALRSLVRVNSYYMDNPDNAARLKMLKKAMDLAENDGDKSMVLGGLGQVRDIATLRYVVPYLDQKNLAQAACRAIVDLAHYRSLRDPNVAEFGRALDRVIAISQDKGLIERAQKYKQGF